MRLLLFFLVYFLLFTANAQYNGATPWENCYGKNASCKYVGCSDIKVITSSESSIVAIVKKDGKVIKHAFISAGNSYTFQMPDGTYQVFFYYGSGWNGNKSMRSKDCYTLKGGFNSDESVSKTNLITLKGQIMTYTLTYSKTGNFSPKSSSLEEAL